MGLYSYEELNLKATPCIIAKFISGIISSGQESTEACR